MVQGNERTLGIGGGFVHQERWQSGFLAQRAYVKQGGCVGHIRIGAGAEIQLVDLEEWRQEKVLVERHLVVGQIAQVVFLLKRTVERGGANTRLGQDVQAVVPYGEVEGAGASEKRVVNG